MSSLHHDDQAVSANGERWPEGYHPEYNGYVWTTTEAGPSLEDLDAAAAMFGEGDDLGDLSSGLLMAAGWPRTRAEFELRRLGVMSRDLAERIARTRFDAGLD
jgi:hypothetical protein